MPISITKIKSQFYSHLQHLYPENEIRSFISIALEHVMGFSKIDLITKESEVINPLQEQQLIDIILRLQQNEPIQYIIGKAEFYGLSFNVNTSVLIPRPETEELVNLIIAKIPKDKEVRILDIGTGSGCIAIALKKNVSNAIVHALDISKNALTTANENARLNNTSIYFLQANILQEDYKDLPSIDIIVSNPPYIPENEKRQMDKNVVDYEPHLALFTPIKSPLLFYEAIINIAKHRLSKNGQLFFEVHEKYAQEVGNLLRSYPFTEVIIHRDINGKDRMVSAIKLG